MDDKKTKTKKKHRDGFYYYKYLIVMGSFIAYFMCDGVSLSFGIFMREMIDYFDKKDSVYLIYLTAGLLESIPLFLSPLFCYLIESYGCRRIALIGSVILLSSFILTRFFVYNLLTLNIVIGLVKGAGLAMIYIPSYLIIPYYYEKRRALATGIAVSGSGLGLFLLSPLAEYLINTYGWMNAWLLIGAISSHTFVSALTYRSTKQEETEVEDGQEKETFLHFFSKFSLVFSNKRYILVTLSYFFLSAAIISPHMFLPSHFSLRSDLDDPNSISISLLGISNIIGQILVGWIADLYRDKNWLIFSVSMVLGGLLTCVLPILNNIYLVYLYSVMFGFLKSVDYVLQSTLVIESGLGLEHLTAAFGWLQLTQAISVLIGTLLLGYIKGFSLDYSLTFIVSGIFLVVAGASLFFWPLFKPRVKPSEPSDNKIDESL